MESTPEIPTPASETAENSTPEPPTPSGESGESLLSVVAASVRRVWNSGGIIHVILYVFVLLRRAILSRLFLLTLLCGAGLGLALALGSSYGIGFRNAWKLYGHWWVLSQPLGPLALVLFLVFIAATQYVETLFKKNGPFLVGAAMGVVTCAGFVVAGYEGTRSDYPLLSSTPANLEALSKSVGEQTRNLGGLSQSGAKLLNQLNATETELETAKKRLAVTLGTFDAQRQAAQQVTEAMKQLDVRQKQIALQTEELERILGGQQPITRNDLQRANTQGLLYGFLLGFVTSFLAYYTYGALRKRRVLPQ